jgi:hypothetical protein
VHSRALVLVVLVGCGAPTAPAHMAPDESVPARAPVTFACDESAVGAPIELRRLTMTQYRNTLRDLTRWSLGDAAHADAVLALAGFEALPIDRKLDQTIDQAHVDETIRVARQLGALLTAPERLALLAGECAIDADASNDEVCVSSFIRTFGARALRRPLDADDERFYRVIYGDDPSPSAAAYADVITVLLSAPESLYFVEHGVDQAHALSPYELASRLSYHYWQTAPDDALWQAAEDGSLLDDSVLQAQVERLLSDPRARDAMTELFSEWLALDEVPSGQLREPALQEALDMLAYYTFTEPAGVEALFTSERSFARGEALARVYGVPPWDGSAVPPVLPPGERPGLLTRAWFLTSGSLSSRPIRRGVFVRRKLLCDELAPPPSGVSALPPAPATGRTTRQVVEQLTEQPGTACAYCHASLINPLGFAFEGFDGLGQARDEQALFDATGAPLGTLPVDTTTTPRVTPEDETLAHGPAELAALMLQSGKLEACLARNYFRFAFGRLDDAARDGCALERLRSSLSKGGLRAMLAEVAQLPELRERRFEP